MRRIIIGLIGLAMFTAGARGNNAAQSDRALAAKARSTLWQVFETEHDWVRVHAAEALIAAGDGAKIRAIFQRDLAAWEKTPARIGAYRVLATLADSPGERAKYVAAVERVYLDPASPDRPQAVETLGKLGAVVTGATLAAVRDQAAHAAPADTIMPLWVVVNAGDTAARRRLVQALASDEAAVQQRAAYALRWLRPDDDAVREALAHAAAEVKPGTLPYAYVLSAALRNWPAAPDAAKWREQLEGVLANGDAGARFEAAQTLQFSLRRTELAALAPLLEKPEGDTRIAGALLILHGLDRRER